jgi:RNA polymerase-binding transcription factor DksA
MIRGLHDLSTPPTQSEWIDQHQSGRCRHEHTFAGASHIKGQSVLDISTKQFDQRLANMQAELLTLLKTHLGDDASHPLISRLTEHEANTESLVADLCEEMDLTVYQREVSQLNDIAAARERIRQGTFGMCIDCEAPVGIQRLEAYPTAKRCLSCQALHEKRLPSRNTR